MGAFLLANLGTIAIGLLVLAVVVLIVVKLIRDRRRGRSCCGGSCEHCPGACHGGKKT